MWPLLPILIVYFLPVDSLNNGGGWRQQQVVPSSIKEITLNDPWVIEGTIILLSDQDTLPVVDWLWNDSLKLFSAILPSLKTSDTLTIVWRSASITDRSTFFYFQPSDLDSIPENAPDTSFTKPTTRIKSPLDAWSGIRRSGTIVRGIKFGSAGESGSTAGLHLELSGRPSPGIEVEAVVDDRGLGGSTGGSSATLAELDRLYITASTPNLSGTLGDWDLNWSEGEFGRIERRLKGGKFSIFNSRSKLDFAVAGGNNRFATAKIYGYSGNQGPYELPSRFGAVGVTIIAGSEKVWLNNRILRRGLEADYSIDYERGTITFQPSVPIMDGSRIEVEYEYSDDTYSKRFLAAKGNASRSAGRDGWKFDVVVAEEGFDGNNPLAFEWTPESRTAISNAGDNQREASTTGITIVGPSHGDYVWGTSEDGDSILVFSPPDSLGKPTGYLKVEFSLAANADYLRTYDLNLLFFKYYWAGVGKGFYSPSRSIPLPDRTRLGVARGSWTGAGFSSSIETALSEYDKNVLSPKDDGDNRGAAVSWHGGWSNVDSSLRANLSARQLQTNFRNLSTQQRTDFRYHWGITLTRPMLPETGYEGNVQYKPLPFLTILGNAGWIKFGKDFTGKRGGLTARIDRDNFDSEINFEKLSNSSIINNIKKENIDRLSGFVSGNYSILRPRYKTLFEKIETKWTSQSDGNLQFENSPGLGIDAADWAVLDLDYTYRIEAVTLLNKYYRSSWLHSMQFGWKGKLEAAQWQSTILRSLSSDYYDWDKTQESTSATITTLIGNYRSPFRFTGDYRLSSGDTRSEVWVASYSGEGNGGYRREGDRYVPDPDGEIDLQRVITDGTEFASSVDFNGRLEWRPEPDGGDSSNVKYPFGISGTTTRFEASALTTEPDPISTFLLDRSAFRSSLVKRSRWNWQQEIEFLDNESPGDGRLTLKRDESHDAGFSGGEENLLESLRFRLRLRFAELTSIQLLPLIERQRRWEITTSTLRADVRASGADIEIDQSSASRRWESSLKIGREVRREKVRSASVVETRAQPMLLRRFGDQGSGRLEGEWRRLDPSSSGATYDLLRGWYAGDNFSAGFSLDYRLGDNLTATASLRSRWRPERAPLLSALVEMTATL